MAQKDEDLQSTGLGLDQLNIWPQSQISRQHHTGGFLHTPNLMQYYKSKYILMGFETKLEFDGRIVSVGAILRNQEGYIILQKLPVENITDTALITGFGGFTLANETPYDTLKRALADELKFKIDKNGSKAIPFKYVETKTPDMYDVYVYIDDVDESKLETVNDLVKVKFLTQVKESEKADWLLNIKDDELPGRV